jgi:hypothetical protein
MNRLKNQRCYLSGAMEFCADFGAEWRKKARSDLRDMGLVFLDPTDKPIDAIDEPTLLRSLQIARQTEDYEAIAEKKFIRHIDLRLCDLADFLIVNLDTTINTCGTWEEIFNSNREKKPILVRIVQGKIHAPTWLLWTIPHQHIFSTWDELYANLRDIDTNVNSSTYNRWLFFDLDSDRVR